MNSFNFETNIKVIHYLRGFKIIMSLINFREKTKIRYEKVIDKKNMIGKEFQGKKITNKQFYLYIKEICRNDIQLFSILFFPHYNVYPHNRFHLESFDLLEKGHVRIAEAASRGLAKSSTFSLVGVLHDICYEREQYIVILSNTESQVLSHAKNIIFELSDNDRLISVFGNLLKGKKTAPHDFICENSVKISARGSSSSLRGMRHGAYRPTKIIMDDVEDDETVANPVTREKFENWFYKEVSFLGSKETKFHFIGTILHEESLLTKIQANPAYISKTYPMILKWDNQPKLWNEWKDIYINKDNDNHVKDSDEFFEKNKDKMLEGTEVIWPEKEDYLSLQKKIIEIGKHSFMQEYQMEAIDLSKVLFNQFYYFDYVTDPIHGEGIKTHHGRFIPMSGLDVQMSIDPTAGSKDQTKGDATSIILGYVEAMAIKEDKRLFVFADWTKNAKPSEWIERMFILADEYKVTKITIEENLYRNFLKENLHTAKTNMLNNGTLKRNITPVIKEILSHIQKEKRIMQIEPKVHSGSIQFIRRGLSEMFWQQMRNYIPNGKCKDDVPDSLEMLWTSVRGYNGAGVVNKPQSRHLEGII